jgi:hypothetical protein
MEEARQASHRTIARGQGFDRDAEAAAKSHTAPADWAIGYRGSPFKFRKKGRVGLMAFASSVA